MAKFEAGSDPADHTVAEVVEFLKSDEITGDEYDRVVQVEREGRNRVGIMSGSGVEDPPADPPEAPAVLDPTAEPAVTPDEPVDPDDEPTTEQGAHDMAIANLSKEAYNALPADRREGSDPVRDTPLTVEEALAESSRLSARWARPVRATETTELS